MIVAINFHLMKEKNLTITEAFVIGYIQTIINDKTPMQVVVNKADFLKNLEYVIKGHDTFYRMYRKFEKLKLIYVRSIEQNYVFQIHPFKENHEFKNKRINKTVYVYLMVDDYTNLYKIGKSNNVHFREKTLLSQTPKIRLIHYFNRPDYLESDLHKKYKSQRVRGEWFELTQEDVEFIKSL